MGVKRETGSRMAARFFFCSVFLWAWAAIAHEAPDGPEAASGWQEQAQAVGRHAMVVTANTHATDAALEILALGGNAIDAAIAAEFVLNLVEPQSSGIGGGGFLLHFDARTRRLVAYDGRETAPASARPERFLGPDGAAIDWSDALASGRAVGVPGLVAMLAMAHERHGHLRWQRLLRPALRLAEEGFEVSPRLHHLLQVDGSLRSDDQARRLYYQEDGSALPVGARLANPRFALTLRQLSEQGPRAFYQGDIARAIVAAIAARPGAPADLSMGDLAAYRARERQAVCRRYRSYRVCGMPPPSSAGVTVAQLLGLLQRTAFARQAPLSPLAVHYFAEAGRLAYADRGRYLADPGFVEVPLQALLAAPYLEVRSRLISPRRSMGAALPGEIGRVKRGDSASPERPGTTHLSIVDAQGNAVALTASIESAFGSRIMARGFLLNNQLTDFSFLPSRDGQLLANRVEPGKRPLSSMAPTLVFDRHDRLYAVLGSAGGTRIINDVAQTLSAVLDWRMGPAAALALPHYGSRNGPTELERGRAPAELAEALRALGHRVELQTMNSGIHLIVRGESAWLGAADPRREGSARGN